MTDLSHLIERLRKPVPKFGLEEFDPTYDVRQEAADALLAHAAEMAAKDSWVMHWQTKCQATRALEIEATRQRDEALAALKASEERGTQNAEDAERWRALMSSQRMHMMGSFGFDYVFDPPDSKKTADLVDVVPRAGDHMHFGIEFWSEHSAFGDPKWPDTFPRKVLTTYVDEMRARSVLAGKLADATNNPPSDTGTEQREAGR